MSKEIDPIDAATAANLSGLSPTMITYLSRIDVLKPQGHEKPQRGKRRQFTFTDVLFLRVISELLSKGIEVKRLGSALMRAKGDAEAWKSISKAPGRYLVTDGTELYIRREGQLESKTFNGQLAFGFVLDLAVAEAALMKSWPKRHAA